MKNTFKGITFLTVMLFLAGLNSSFSYTTNTGLSNFLTPGDIDTVSAIRGVIETERLSKRNNGGGSLNFTNADRGQLLSVIIQVVSPEDFRELEKTKEFRSLYAGPVAEIGDAAYQGPASGDRYILSFLKGNYWITLSSYLTIPSLKPIFDQDDLRKFANIIISRLQ